MRHLLLTPVRLVWRASGLFRGPIHRRFEAWFFHRVEPRSRALAAEVAPGLHALLRELARLQSQVDALQAAIDDRADARADPSESRAKAG